MVHRDTKSMLKRSGLWIEYHLQKGEHHEITTENQMPSRMLCNEVPLKTACDWTLVVGEIP
jgi:hypothetical protein